MKTLSQTIRYAVAAMLAAFPFYASQADTAGTVSLDQLMVTFRTVRHVDARYVEHRYLRALRMPLESRGALRFDAPDRLVKATDPGPDGTADRLTIAGNQVTIERAGGKPPLVIMLNNHPEIGVLVESIRATLSGDGDALRRIFDITLAGTIDQWQLVLQPRDTRQRDILQWMRIDGYRARITAIETRDGDGDRSQMSIVQLAP